ncbi:LysM peptidoglycan-binding domain-containing protein [Agrobacterium sp.]|uniref:LysM peptidoglycan-binding domain-containing protein n=1 Tax=Agrobacterium sp. TaxID=361 RepID=UPI0028A776E8|nr:LysM peptidoglycan-binding domain-containing protein [Agrobacterium sp.]
MKNKRAGLLALIVLAVATLLMVFFVLPRISQDGKPIGDAINNAGTAVKDAVELGGQSASDILNDAAEETTKVADKVARLAASATDSINQMTGLFTDGKVPSDADYAAARTKVEAALKELSDVDIPDTLDDTTSRLITTARAAAERASTFLTELPVSARDAAARIGRLAGIFAGTDDGAPIAQEPAPAANQQSSADLPTFDVLRVEPDGSAVIAGKAKAGSTLEIINNGQVISKADIGQNGDFAAVLDNPLPPGDHQLVLRSTDKDGTVLQSDEIATVSVPKDKAGNLLAMVTKPGKASRLLTLPESTASDAPGAEVATQTSAPAETTGLPGLPAGAGEVATQPPAIGTTAPSDATTSEKAAIQVTAVEFEGDKIFIAGAAPAGSTIRALVDDKAIGNTTTQPSGSFVVEGTIDLSVGNHTVSTEMLGSDGKVLVRVNVPFARPAGEQVAVTVQPGAAAATSTAAVESPLSDASVFRNLREEVAKAFGLLQALYADGKTPQMEQMVAARSATSFALKSLSEFRAAASAEAGFATFVGTTANQASEIASVLDKLPNDVKAVGNALSGLATRIAELTSTPVPVSNEGPKTFEQAPLAHNENAIIIRRGDTLWQISRRIYGQGVRYTTIYLANQDQIKNPDLIEPGQIFGLPEKALPNAEELHRKRLTGG